MSNYKIDTIAEIDIDKILDIYNFEIYTSKGVYLTNYKEKQLKEQPLLNLGSVSINK